MSLRDTIQRGSNQFNKFENSEVILSKNSEEHSRLKQHFHRKLLGFLDLNQIEDSGGGPDVVVALHPGIDKVVLLQSDNKLSIETFEEVMDLALAGCRAVAAFMKEQLIEHVKLLSLTQKPQGNA